MKALAEEMQAVSKGLEKMEQELTASENDGAISIGFQKVWNLMFIWFFARNLVASSPSDGNPSIIFSLH